MKKIATLLAILFFVGNAFAQNIGINNTDPKSALDINGGIRLRPQSAIVDGTSVTLTSNNGHHFIGGLATGNFTINFATLPESGQHAIITNTTGFTGNIFSLLIPAQTTVELIFSNGEWKQIGSSQPVTGTAWGLKGNAGTDTSINFIGTTDGKALIFKINSQRAGLIDNTRQNTALGYLAMPFSTGGYFNTAIGADALRQFKFGNYNTVIGVHAANDLKIGEDNVVLGGFALSVDTASSGTVAIGAGALSFNQARFGNTAVGRAALYYNTRNDLGPIASTEGLHNTALGYATLRDNRSGSGAVAIGYSAAFSDTKAEGIIAIGRGALYSNNNRSGNIAIGDSSLFYNSSTAVFSTQGTKNTAVGDHTLFGNATGSYNTAIGSYALTSNTKGGSNTAMGIDALRNNLTGNNNTGLGENALQLNINGHRNTAIGSTAMQYRTTGDDNVAIGWGALLLDDNAKQNTAIGNGALLNQTSGIENVAVGFSAGLGNQTGNFNVFIGGHSGAFSNNASNRLYISNSANDDSTTSLIYGNFESDSLLLNAKTVIKNNAVIRGYTKLGGYGADVPSIKMKKINVTNGGVGIQTGYDHGLTQSKILSVSVLINATSGNDIAPRSTYAGFEYDYFVGSTKIFIRNISGNDASIAGRPVKILITYEE